MRPGHSCPPLLLLRQPHRRVLLKLDLTEPPELYIMNHTVIAALALLYLLLTSLWPRQVGGTRGHSTSSRAQ